MAAIAPMGRSYKKVGWTMGLDPTTGAIAAMAPTGHKGAPTERRRLYIPAD
jgi:hypothetical protein